MSDFTLLTQGSSRMCNSYDTEWNVSTSSIFLLHFFALFVYLYVVVLDYTISTC